MLNDIQRQFVKKFQQKKYSERDLMVECAEDFGRLIAHAEKDGLSIPVAYELARNHFRIYGKAMMEFADLVTIEMMPTPKSPQTQKEREGKN